MQRGLLQDLANTLCQMVPGAISPQDYEQLAARPDGEVLVNLRDRSAQHNCGQSLELEAVGRLSQWLSARLLAEQLSLTELTRAEIEIHYKTDRVRTNREKLVSFDVQSASTIEASGQKVSGIPASRHVYHERVVV
jgi:hypothetical protein